MATIVECEICESDIENSKEAAVCFKCGAVYGPCCASAEDKLCKECDGVDDDDEEDDLDEDEEEEDDDSDDDEEEEGDDDDDDDDDDVEIDVPPPAA
jgi:hypothetical protein